MACACGFEVTLFAILAKMAHSEVPLSELADFSLAVLSPTTVEQSALRTRRRQMTIPWAAKLVRSFRTGTGHA